MADPKDIPSKVNLTRGVIGENRINALLNPGSYTIDGIDIDIDDPAFFFHPIRCKSFEACEGSVSYYTKPAGKGFWSPYDLELDVIAWFDAADEDTITSVSGNLSNWKSKAAYNHSLTVGSGTPTTSEDKVNGLNVVSLDGSSSLKSDDITMPSSASFFIVAIPQAIDESGDTILSWKAKSGWAGSFKLIASSVGNFFNKLFGNKVGPNTEGTLSVIMSKGPFNGPSVYSAVFDYKKSFKKIFIDGEDVGDYSSDVWDAEWRYGYIDVDGDQIRDEDRVLSTVGNLRVFSGWSDLVQPAGVVAEIIVCSYVNSDARQYIEGYLAYKWGLQDSLPGGHKFKAGPPRSLS